MGVCVAELLTSNSTFQLSNEAFLKLALAAGDISRFMPSSQSGTNKWAHDIHPHIEQLVGRTLQTHYGVQHIGIRVLLPLSFESNVLLVECKHSHSLVL